MSHDTCHILPFTCHMIYFKCLCWSLGHAEQLLFSCLCSKVSICNYVTCHISHVTCHIAHVTCHMSNAYVDSWDMLNNFCFDVYAQKWVFVTMSHVTFRMSHVTMRMSHVICQMLMTACMELIFGLLRKMTNWHCMRFNSVSIIPCHPLPCS